MTKNSKVRHNGIYYQKQKQSQTESGGAHSAFKYFLIILFSLMLLPLWAFMDGEELVFDIKYNFITAGEATLSVEQTTFRDSIAVYQITSTARTNSFFDRVFMVRDRIESIMDKNGLFSHRYTKMLREGRYRQYRIHLYYPEQGFTVYRRFNYRNETWGQKRMDLPGKTQDVLSAFYLARTKNLNPGQNIFINVTADGINYDAEVKVHPPEMVSTIWGNKECLILEPILQDEAIFKQTGTVLIWVTNDEYKVPVKLQSRVIIGSFYAILTSAKNVPYKLAR